MAEMPAAIDPAADTTTDAAQATNCAVPGLWLIRPEDVDRQAILLQNAWRVRELWDDEARAAPGQWFMFHYLNPCNLLFDLCNGAGLIAFIHTIPGWRSVVFAAVWRRRAMRRDDLFQSACKLAMLTSDLLVIDSFVQISNTLSQRATLRNGFINRGIICPAARYNGAVNPMYWNEVTRAILGLDPPMLPEAH
jgi:hypothetical protein